MRRYTPAETCMLLLFAKWDRYPAMTVHTYRGLRKMLEALGRSPADPTGQVDREELRRLGMREGQIDQVLYRLEREDALSAHLRDMASRGIQVVTRVSPEYPQKLRRTMGDAAPMILYCAGETRLFGNPCVSLVGSRQLREPGREFAKALGRQAARAGYTYVSGGAVGADAAGFDGTWEADGAAILFLPDSLDVRIRQFLPALRSRQLLLVSEQGFDLSFTASRAHSRNRLIHAMGEKVFVAQSGNGTGGTWQGTLENLKNGWSPVYVCSEEPEDPAAAALIAQGCTPAKTADLETILERP